VEIEEEETMKELKLNELKEVSGGNNQARGMYCPVCNTFCKQGEDILIEGEGCDKNIYWLCPNCGNKWE